MERTIPLRLGLLAALFLVVAACGGNTDGAATGDDPAGDPVDGDTPTALGFTADGTAAVARPGIGEELRLALVRPASFLPYELSTAEQEAVIVADLLYDGLTEAVGGQGQLRPGLATAWTANADATSWIFTLDPDRATPGAVVAHFAVLEAEATGATASVLDSIAAVESAGDARVRFDLRTPNGGFPWLLSGVAFSLVGEGGAPTGRYDVQSDDEDKMVLRAATGDRPDVTLVWEDTAREAYNRLTVGVIDAAVAPPDALDDARSRFGVSSPARAISRFYVVNPASGRLSDERLRHALLAAIDRPSIVAEELSVPAFALDGILAPTLAGFGRGDCDDRCDHDPDAAAATVRSVVGSEADASVEIRIAVTDDQVPVAEVIAADLAAAGFAPVVSAHEPDELAAVVARGDADLYAVGWVAPAPTIDAVVLTLFTGVAPIGIEIAAVPGMAELLDDASATVDDDARWRLLLDAHDTALREGLIVPIAVAKSYVVAAPQAQAIPVRADGSLDLVGVE